MKESDAILKRLQAAIAACPYIDRSEAPIFTDYIRESEPCCGIFPEGEKRLFIDWAGNERRQYDFTIQVTGYGLQECERAENEAFAERISRWAAGLKKGAIDLGEQGRFESLWIGQGKLLYPTQDGQTFIYALQGRLTYQRKMPDEQPRIRWFFGFGPPGERVWAECAAGIGKVHTDKGRCQWFYDFDGRRQKEKSDMGTVVFSGCLCPEDPFQQKAAGPLEEEVLWVRVVCGRAARSLPAEGGTCTILTEGILEADAQKAGEISIQVQFLTSQKGFFWLDEEGNGAFLPERIGKWEGMV